MTMLFWTECSEKKRENSQVSFPCLFEPLFWENMIESGLNSLLGVVGFSRLGSDKPGHAGKCLLCCSMLLAKVLGHRTHWEKSVTSGVKGRSGLGMLFAARLACESNSSLPATCISLELCMLSASAGPAMPAIGATLARGSGASACSPS